MEADADELIPKKKKAKGTPSAALGRAPDVEPLPVPGSATGSCPDGRRMEDKLRQTAGGPSAWHRTPATVAQQSQTAASSTAPQGPDMGGFLARLRKSILWAGT